MKKKYWIAIGYALVLCLSGISWTACSQEEELSENAPDTGMGGFVFTVNPPELKGINTRALFPLGPEMENPIKNLALLVFDKEGMHKIDDKNYYIFRQYANKENPDGQLQVFEKKYPGDLPPNDIVTLCAVANVNQEKLLAGLRKHGDGNSISLKKFKELHISLPYYEHSDSVGLVKNIYMFGYHYGPLAPDNPAFVNIAMGRIISRLNISLSISQGLKNIPDMKYAIRLLNTSRAIHVFPAEKSPTEEGTVVSDPYFAPVKLNEKPETFYYYVGPHYAVNKEEATQIEIVYGTELPEGVFNDDPQIGKRVQVAICNDPPSVTENRDFRINRNCIYNIHIHLKKRGETETQTRQDGSQAWIVELD